MVPEAQTRMHHTTGCLGKLRDHVLHPYATQFRIGHRDDLLPGRIVRVAEDVADVMDRAGDDTMLLEDLHRLDQRSRSEPSAQDGVELLGVFDWAGVIFEPGVLDQV